MTFIESTRREAPAMPDLFDATLIPDDPAYWNELAQRVAANALRRSTANSFDWLAHSRASWVAASVLLAAALALLALRRNEPSGMSLSAEWAQAVAPSDELGRATVVSGAPPAIGALLLRYQGL